MVFVASDLISDALGCSLRDFLRETLMAGVFKDWH
jgi:hypothetical protein